jgi:uncharacterized membrane protein YfhO
MQLGVEDCCHDLHGSDLTPMDDYQLMTYQLPPTATGWLVVSEAYHPDWSVTIDGKPAQTTRAEAALLSTYVPQGSHEVTFRFQAPFWYTASA